MQFLLVKPRSSSRLVRSVAAVPQQIDLGFNGYYEISYQTNASTPVHWVLEGNSINETSFSAPSDGLDFPVQAGVHYSILVYNEPCLKDMGFLAHTNICTTLSM